VLFLPCLGASSDYSDSEWGRRKVYIFNASIVAATGFCLYPFAETLGYRLGDTDVSHTWAIAIALLCLMVRPV
jgi:hypothetical protein